MSPAGCPNMSATPCNRNADESFPVLRLKSREQKSPTPLLIQDKDVLQPSSLRQRSMLVAMASRPVQHMQKALEQMHLTLTEVVSDITGKTGMTILRAILAGERDPQQLATYRDKR